MEHDLNSSLCLKGGENKEKINLLFRCTDQPRDSDDQISEHNCCKWNNEKHGEGDIANKCRSTSLLLCDHSQQHLLFGVVSNEGSSH